MSEASLNIWRRCVVEMTFSDAHFLRQLRTSRRKIVFSAVNSLVAAHTISGSMFCSILSSRACMEALGFNSRKSSCADFWDVPEMVDVKEAVSVAVDMGLWRGHALKASASGMSMRTCWHTMREGMNHPAGAK